MPAALTRKSASVAALGDLVAVAEVGEVRGHRLAAGVGDALEAGRVDVDGEHGHALGGQAQDDGLADAARRSGHDPALAVRTRQERPHPRPVARPKGDYIETLS